MKTNSQILESIAFNWCKVATILLLLWALHLDRWALPIAAVTSAVLFVAAFALGARESRCILRRPLLIAAFWLLVAAAWCQFHRQAKAIFRDPVNNPSAPSASLR